MKTKQERFSNTLALLSYDGNDGDGGYYTFSFTVLYFMTKYNYSLLTDLVSLSESLPFNVSFPEQININ